MDSGGDLNGLRDLLIERGSAHGNFEIQLAFAQKIKAALREGPNWESLRPLQREVLELMATKISRILCGNPFYADHWDDIAGYAQLALAEITRRVPR